MIDISVECNINNTLLTVLFKSIFVFKTFKNCFFILKCIQNFTSQRLFRVRLNKELFTQKILENGILQESVFSVTLFLLL